MNYEFSIVGEIFEWRGPSPFHFIQISSEISETIRSDAKLLSYGWGVIPIRGKVGNTEFTTSLIPKDGNYLVPIKDVIRKNEDLVIGDKIEINFNLGKI